MSKLTEIVNIIIGKTKSIKKEFIVLSDQFIVEREVKVEQIGKTEQLSSSEKPNNHIKTKKCLFCDNQTTGTICSSDECFDKFEKL